MEPVLSTKEKALKINIEFPFFGTIAEIGGGQETAGELFRAGGASNSVAKTISAYDKKFSDHFYNDGKPARYVSSDRLTKMVKTEFDDVVNVMRNADDDREMFAFANTVEIKNYQKTNWSHGWLGLCAEGSDLDDPNLILVHVNLLENDGILQQYTLGKLGVNMMYGYCQFKNEPKKLISSLLDNLSRDRIEIDYVSFSGKDFSDVDNRIMNLHLVREDLTHAIMFDQEGVVHQSSDMLYKKNVLAIRGQFRPINKLGQEIIKNSNEIFQRDASFSPGNTIVFSEITLKYLMRENELDEQDFLDRVACLNELGQCVMVSNFRRFFRLANYFNRFKLKKLRLVVGYPTFEKILSHDFYSDLNGGILEAFGDLFAKNIKLYVYPSLNDNGELLTSKDVEFESGIKHIYDYLISQRKIIDIQKACKSLLNIHNEQVIKLIEDGDESFRELVPEEVAELIVTNNYFGFGLKN